MSDKHVKEVNLRHNAVYIVSNGTLEEVEPPSTGYGQQTIQWQDGQPIHCKISYTKILNK